MLSPSPQAIFTCHELSTNVFYSKNTTFQYCFQILCCICLPWLFCLYLEQFLSPFFGHLWPWHFFKWAQAICFRVECLSFCASVSFFLLSISRHCIFCKNIINVSFFHEDHYRRHAVSVYPITGDVALVTWHVLDFPTVMLVFLCLSLMKVFYRWYFRTLGLWKYLSFPSLVSVDTS